MNLTGDALARLHRALVLAFPTRASLARLLRFGLETNLNEVAAESLALSDGVFQVLRWAEGRSRLGQLVIQAWRYSTGAPELRAFVAEHLPGLLAEERQEELRGIASLLQGMEQARSISGIEQFFHHYLVGESGRPMPFGGRRPQLEALDRWLLEDERPRGVVVAGAGRGKSALLARWVQSLEARKLAEIAFVPISLRFGTASRNMAFALLGARLRALLKTPGELPDSPEVWLREIDWFLRQLRPAGSLPLLVVLDGIDEAVAWQCGQELRFPAVMPPGIKILVSARALASCDEAGWRRRLGWDDGCASIPLPPLDAMGVGEVLASWGAPLDRLSTEVRVVEELHRLSEGDPLLVKLYVDALAGKGSQAAFLAPEALRHLSPGLQAFFEQWWKEQREQWGEQSPLKEPAARAMLFLLAHALAPLSVADLVMLTQDPERTDVLLVEELLGVLGRFIVRDDSGERYVFSHPRLGQFFSEKLSTRESRAGWERRLLAYGERTLQALVAGGDPAEAPRYPVVTYGAHLEAAGASGTRLLELVHPAWMRAWRFHEGVYDGFIADVARARHRVVQEGTRLLGTPALEESLAVQARCLLLEASAHSMAANVPPCVVRELVSRGLWGSVQAMAYVRQLPDPMQRAATLEALVPELPQGMLHEVWSLLRALPEGRNRDLAVQALAERFRKAGLLEQALECVSIIAFPERSLKEQVQLSVMLDFAREGQERRVLEILGMLEGTASMPQALGEVLPRLRDPAMVEQVVARVRAMPRKRALEIACVLPWAPVTSLRELTLEALEEPDKELRQKEVIEALARSILLLPEPQRAEVLEDVLTWSRSSGILIRAWGLLALVPCVAPDQREALCLKVQSVGQLVHDSRFHQALAIQMAGLGMVRQAVEEARSIGYPTDRARVILALRSVLSSEEWNALYEEVVEAARAAPDSGAFSVLAGAVTGKKRDEVLRWGIEALQRAEWMYVDSFLAETAPLLSEKMAAELREVVYSDDREDRAELLALLAPRLPEHLLEEALDQALSLRRGRDFAKDSAFGRAKALSGFVSRLSVPRLQRLLAQIQKLDDMEACWEALAQLATGMREQSEVEALLRFVQGRLGMSKEAEVKAVLRFVLSRPGVDPVYSLLTSAAEAASREGAACLVAFMEREAIRPLGRIGVVRALIRRLMSLPDAEALLDRALVLEETLPPDWEQIRFLAEVIPLLPGPARREALATRALRLLEEVMESARALPRELLSARPHMSGTQWANIPGIASPVSLTELRVTELLTLAAHLPRDEAFNVLRGCVRIPELEPEVYTQTVRLLVSRGFPVDSWLSWLPPRFHLLARAAAARELPLGERELRLSQLLEQARASDDYAAQREVLSVLEEKSPEVLQWRPGEFLRMEELWSMAPAAARFIRFMPAEVLKEFLASWGRSTLRRKLLSAALVRLASVGEGQVALEYLEKLMHAEEAYEMVADGLGAVAPFLDRAAVFRALEMMRDISWDLDGNVQSKAIMSLVLRLAELGDSMGALQSLTELSAPGQAQVLKRLEPLLTSRAVLERALELALAIRQGNEFDESLAEALGAVARGFTRFPPTVQYEAWRRISEGLIGHHRSVVLHALGRLEPLLKSLGSYRAVLRVAEEMVHTQTWFDEETAPSGL